MMSHGVPKLLAGAEMRTKLGSSMDFLGIGFGHTFRGFMAAFAEAFGGLFLILGSWTMVAAILLFITMLVATIMHIKTQGFESSYHAFTLMFVFLGLFVTGPGKWSLDAQYGICMLYNWSQKEDSKTSSKKK